MAATAAIITTVLSTAVAVAGSISQANQQAAMADYQAEVAAKQGELTELSARQEAAKIQEEAQHRRAAQIVEGAAAGVDLTSGSLLDVIASSAKTAEEERQDVLRAGRLNRASFESRSSAYHTYASSSRSAGWWKAGGSLLGGMSQGMAIADKKGWFDRLEGDGTKA